MLTITRTEGVVAVMSHPFTLLVLIMIIGASLVVTWLDRHPASRRRPRPNPYMKPWANRRPGHVEGPR